MITDLTELTKERDGRFNDFKIRFNLTFLTFVAIFIVAFFDVKLFVIIDLFVVAIFFVMLTILSLSKMIYWDIAKRLILLETKKGDE